LRSALVVLGLYGRRPLAGEFVQTLLHLAQVGRQHGRLDAQLARRLVEQVDRLVGQEAAADVAVRERRRGDESLVGDLDLVVSLVLVTQATQDGDRVLDARLADEDRLEAALKGGILLDVFAILVERRRPDGLELAAGEQRLHHVGGVDRALRRTGADDGVQFVDEQDDVARALDLVEDALEPLLELAAILRPGHHAAEVEGEHTLAPQTLGHVAGDDLLGQSFDDRRLPHPRLADEHRVVLGTPAQYLDDPLDLFVTPDDRIELVLASQGGQVSRVHLQHALAGGLFLIIHARRPHLAQSTHEGIFGDAAVAQYRAAPALALEQDAEQQVLGAHERVAQLLRALDGDVEGGLGARREHQLVAGAAMAAAGLDRLVGARHHAALVDAHEAEELVDDAARQAEDPEQQVLGPHLTAAATAHHSLGRLERFARSFGELVHVHMVTAFRFSSLDCSSSSRSWAPIHLRRRRRPDTGTIAAEGSGTRSNLCSRSASATALRASCPACASLACRRSTSCAMASRRSSISRTRAIPARLSPMPVSSWMRRKRSTSRREYRRVFFAERCGRTRPLRS